MTEDNVQQLQFRGMGSPAKQAAAQRPPLKPIEPLGTAPGQQRLFNSPAYEAFKAKRTELGV